MRLQPSSARMGDLASRGSASAASRGSASAALRGSAAAASWRSALAALGFGLSRILGFGLSRIAPRGNKANAQNVWHLLFLSGGAQADLVGRSITKENNLVTCRRSLQTPSIILLFGRKLNLQSFRLDDWKVSDSRPGSFPTHKKKLQTQRKKVTDLKIP